MKLTKKKRRELRNKFERLEGLKYVKGIKRYPNLSWFEWVGYMMK